MHVLVGRKSMTPVGEVIATAKHWGNLRIGNSGVLPNQKGDFFLFWKYNGKKIHNGEYHSIVKQKY
jgi:co-chaperonin GroES (HSP10)